MPPGWMRCRNVRSCKSVLSAQPPKQRILVFQRQVDMIDSQLTLTQRQGQYATRLGIATRRPGSGATAYRASSDEFKSPAGRCANTPWRPIRMTP